MLSGHRLPASREPVVAVARAAAFFAALGVSLVLAGQELSFGSAAAGEFFTKNALGAGIRGRLVLVVLAVAGASALAAVVAIARSGWRTPAWMGRATAIVAPALLAFAVPPLFDWRAWHDHPLPYLLLLSAVVVVGEPLLRSTMRALEPHIDALVGAREHRRGRARWLPLAVVGVASAAYAVFAAYFTIMTHRRMATSAFDLGIYDNLMFNALHGHAFASSVLFGPQPRSYIAGHAEFGMLLFVPFYALAPGPETLLVIQAVLLGFAAVPLYLFARTQVPAKTAAVVSIAYLLYAPLHGPNFYDFHWIVLSVFFYFWLFWAVARKRWVLASLFVLVLLSLREDIAVGTAAWGLFMVLAGWRARFGASLAIVSFAWFVVDKFYIMPAAGTWWFENMYSELFADGQASYASVIKTIVTNPVYLLSTIFRESKLVYGLHIVAPLAFLPLRRPALLLLALPGVLITLLTTGYEPTISISFQYTSHWIPHMFGAAVLALGAIQRMGDGVARRRAAAAVMALAMASHSYVFGAVLQHHSFVGGFQRIAFAMSRHERERYAALTRMVATIPPDASVAAGEAGCPHVSTRRFAYTFRGSFGKVDYILVWRPRLSGDALNVLKAAFVEADYGLVSSWEDELYLFERGSSAPGTDAARAALGLPPRG